MSIDHASPINPDFTVCPQIRPEDVEVIKAKGYQTLMNNRPDGESPDQPLNADIAKAAQAAGIDYIFLPVVGSNLTPDNVRKMVDLLAQAKKPIFAFCRSGARCNALYQLAQAQH